MKCVRQQFFLALRAETLAQVQLEDLELALGEMDQAFELLEKSIEEREPPAAFTNTEPMFDPLRSDPRYRTLMQKMNLEP